MQANLKSMSTLYHTLKKNLPPKPYCTDDLLFGLQIRPAEQAIKKRYIQPNKPTDLRWLVYDIDSPTAIVDWQDRPVPAPNITTLNPQNGHAHLFYGLEVPVYLQAGARVNPIRYVSSIDVALTQTLEADPNYAKLIAKNPLHSHWDSSIWREQSYTLDELADYLDLSSFKDKRTRLPEVGLGRNCNLFDSTRFWAYREIRKPPVDSLFAEFYTLDDFIRRCQNYAILHNTFEIPLDIRECETIGKSVGKWVYNHMSPAGFIEWCHRRARIGNAKSLEVRRARAEDRAELVRDYLLHHPLATIREIAAALNIPRSSVSRCLNG